MYQELEPMSKALFKSRVSENWAHTSKAVKGPNAVIGKEVKIKQKYPKVPGPGQYDSLSYEYTVKFSVI